MVRAEIGRAAGVSTDMVLMDSSARDPDGRLGDDIWALALAGNQHPIIARH
jgi:hypothetical protein